MRRYGIHLNALRAFEAAARLSSFSKAGTELNVSHSTISHHIRGLESELGVALFNRERRQVVLSDEAVSLYRVLNRSFDQISRELGGLATIKSASPLRVTVTPSFANKWLIPNLRWFREAYPDIEVLVKSSLKLDDFSHDNLDVGIRTGAGNWAGLRSEWLMPVHMTPMCSPDYLAARGHQIDFKDFDGHTLIHADVIPGTGIESEWSEWLSAVGVNNGASAGRLSVQDPGLALQAAKDGLGIAMGYLELAETDLKRGDLVRLSSQVVDHPWSYYVVTPEESIDDPRVTVFCAWLQRQVGGAGSEG